ncbi:MAG: rRNA maturation RNase YbeY [Chloroflexota bacterium]|nr:rRNA maturation RNase YbeY [Chloroflexota bacterium]
MEITIRVHSRFSSRVNRARLVRVTRRTLRAERVDAALAIYITTDAEMRALNRKFHATNAATDVLAFPMEGVQGRSIERPYIGDIVISYDRARAQARVARWRIADELDLLAVHGILHLLGYDDLTPRKRAKMWKRQEEIVGKVAGIQPDRA